MEMPPKDCSTDLVQAKSPYCTSGIANMLLRCLMVELSYKALWRRWLPFQVGEKKMAVSILSTLQSFLLFHYHLYSEKRKWKNGVNPSDQTTGKVKMSYTYQRVWQRRTGMNGRVHTREFKLAIARQ